MLINTPADLLAAKPSAEQQAFLISLYNDFISFDEADYPEGYDRFLAPDSEGYIQPVLRQQWNAGAAAAWGFSNRDQIVALLEAKPTEAGVL